MKQFQPGEPVPPFHGGTASNSRFRFDSMAGRYVVLCLFGYASHPTVRRVLDNFLSKRQVFDDQRACFFGVSIDPEDERQGRIRQSLPGIRFFRDYDSAISRLYGVIPDDQPGGYRPMTLVLDYRLRVMSKIPLASDPDNHVERVLAVLASGEPIPPARPAEPQAPVLVVPRIFEPAFCRQLIDIYESSGGAESGFMREINGRTVGVMDPQFKRRRDADITDPAVRKACLERIRDRLVPEIAKAYQYAATRMERYIVVCYDASTGGYFRPHRDNTTKGTAHRRFAVSINLNAEEFEGGDLRFPEFGQQTYRPPTGGAVVFSCSLLHEATPVTNGKRYAFLPFLYDEIAEKLREENLQYLDNAPAAQPPPRQSTGE